MPSAVDRHSFGTVKMEWTQALDDQLCDLVAEDRHSFGRIADLMGLTRHQVTSRWRRIVASHGWQAA